MFKTIFLHVEHFTFTGLFELPEDSSIPDDEHFVDIEDTPGYQTAYSQLVFAGKRKFNPLEGVDDPKLCLATALGKLSVGQPGLLAPLLSQMQPQPRDFLQKYLQAANVTIG